MNKSGIIILATAALAAMLNGCSKSEVQSGEKQNDRYSITVESCSFGSATDGFSDEWAYGDDIAVFHSLSGSKSYGTNDSFLLTDAPTGRFEGKLTENVEKGKSYDWYAIYPHNVKITSPAYETRGPITVGTPSQTQTGPGSISHLTGPQMTAWASAKRIEGGSTVRLEMHPFSSVIAIRAVNKTSKAVNISKASVTADTDICGTYFFDIIGETPKLFPSGDGDVYKTATLNVSNVNLASGDSTCLYLAVSPFSADGLTVAVNGEKKTFSFGGGMEFEAGNISTLRFVLGDSGGTGTESETSIGGWAELPAIADSDGNRIDDKNPSYYYAYHSFSSGSRSMRNYSVCYSSEHHCAMWVAAPRHKCYEGSAGRTDAYGKDPDIPSNIQPDSKDTGAGCNKGHLLGSAERTCSSAANKQVFYYSNIAPQYSSGYNTGGGGWNILEDYIDTQVCQDTLYEVVGCYYSSFTDGYGYSASPKTISFGGRSDVSCPTMFYYAVLRTKKGNSGKSVINCRPDELQCVAFVRSHNNGLKGQKVSSKEMMSISDLEKITGFTYFVNVPNAPKGTFNANDWL